MSDYETALWRADELVASIERAVRVRVDADKKRLRSKPRRARALILEIAQSMDRSTFGKSQAMVDWMMNSEIHDTPRAEDSGVPLL